MHRQVARSAATRTVLVSDCSHNLSKTVPAISAKASLTTPMEWRVIASSCHREDGMAAGRKVKGAFAALKWAYQCHLRLCSQCFLITVG